MFGLSIWELLIILAIVLLLFGPKRLKNIGADLGNAIKGFRTAVAEEDKPEQVADAKVIEGDAANTQSTSASNKQNSDAGA
ncbi:MAG: twin-arginine translocase TatA/TatE family subunit [Pseudomonadales bacterium]